MTMLHRVAVLTVAAAAFAVVAGQQEARALGSATGDLGAGGTAAGDISREAGEVDSIRVELVAGSTVDLKFSATFETAVDLVDATGAELPVTWSGTTIRTAAGVPVTSTGRHVFHVRAMNGGQGTYSFTATPRWAPKLTMTGAMGEALVVSLPAGGTMKGKIAASGGAWTPTITAIEGPDGAQLLAGSVAGKNGAAKLPTTVAGTSGAHRLLVGGGEIGGTFSAAITRKAPKVKPTKIDLRNGLTLIGFAKDGVGAMLTTKCGACHAWTGSARSAKPFASSALARVVSGQMPQGGPKLPASEVGLIRSWITTGMNE